MQRTVLGAVLELQGFVSSRGLPACTRAISHASHSLKNDDDSPQHQGFAALSSGPLPSAPSLLRGRRALFGGVLGRPFDNLQLRFMAGAGPDVSTTQENTWLEYRTKYAEEKRNDLGQAMYALILTFGFSAWLNEFMAYPPRVVMMLGIVFLVLYVRR